MSVCKAPERSVPDIGSQIREARIKKGWTQIYLAEECGVSLSAVSRWENGRIQALKEKSQKVLESALGIEYEPPKVQEEPYRDEFCLALIELRTRSGLSQAKVAKALRISPSAIARWETGHARPNAKRMMQLAALYGVPVNG